MTSALMCECVTLAVLRGVRHLPAVVETHGAALHQEIRILPAGDLGEGEAGLRMYLGVVR